jgi:acetyl-CoA acyltransferase
VRTTEYLDGQPHTQEHIFDTDEGPRADTSP